MPGYLAYLGVGFGNEPEPTRRIWRNGLVFIGTFVLCFVLLGMVAGKIGSFLLVATRPAEILAGLAYLIIGITMLELPWSRWIPFSFHLPVGDRKLQEGEGFLLGAVFALSWTPCLGPVLGALLTMAARTKTAYLGGVLLLFYGLGLAVPFLVLIGGGAGVSSYLSGHRQTLRLVRRLLGGLALGIGLLFLFQEQGLLTALFVHWFPHLAQSSAT